MDGERVCGWSETGISLGKSGQGGPLRKSETVCLLKVTGGTRSLYRRATSGEAGGEQHPLRTARILENWGPLFIQRRGTNSTLVLPVPSLRARTQP